MEMLKFWAMIERGVCAIQSESMKVVPRASKSPVVKSRRISIPSSRAWIEWATPGGKLRGR